MSRKSSYIFIALSFLFFLFPPVYSTQSIDEKVRKVIDDRQDRYSLRSKTEFVADRSEKMLVPRTEEMTVKDFTIAKIPPEIHIMILPGLEPAYFYDYTGGLAYWSNWAKPARSDDNRFFFVVGDDRRFGAKLYLYEYCPARNSLSKILDIAKVLGYTDHSYSDGKINAKPGLMPDGSLLISTHSSHSSENNPDSLMMKSGYRGSWLLSYNIYTHEAKNLGIPLVGHSLPEATLDAQRGRYFCIGEYNGLLCWDTFNCRATYAGYPPNRWVWFKRASLLDETTGKFWSTRSNDEKHRFISFDPELNRFERYELAPPENPYNHEISDLRGYTDKRAIDGSFYCITYNGAMFRFRPEVPSVDTIGVNWDRGRYTSTMALDPTGRYIYYMPGGLQGQNADEYGPIVQYDVKTGTKKVLAWLMDYYYKKYGYWVGGTYGMEISNDGSFLVIVMNGAFKLRSPADFPYGWPALFVVHIPEEEH